MHALPFHGNALMEKDLYLTSIVFCLVLQRQGQLVAATGRVNGSTRAGPMAARAAEEKAASNHGRGRLGVESVGPGDLRRTRRLGADAQRCNGEGEASEGGGSHHGDSGKNLRPRRQIKVERAARGDRINSSSREA